MEVIGQAANQKSNRKLLSMALNSHHALPPFVSDARTAHWAPLTRGLFRCAFIYLVLYALCNGSVSIFRAIPFCGFENYLFTGVAIPLCK
jgi:hypothetical protein